MAFITLLERKLLSLIGLRVGPNKVSVGGILQPIGDALKLSNKSYNLIRNFSLSFYYFSSFSILFRSIFLLSLLFFFPPLISFKYSILFFFLILGFNSLNSIITGWRTFTKYSLVGSLRTVSQLISYEAVLYLVVFSFVYTYFSFDFSSILFFSLSIPFIFLLPCFYIWVPTFLAELNRTPYDFSEGERELVRGFNTEYGSVGFTLIFLSEYRNIFFFCILSGFLFFFPLFLSFFLFIFFVI